MIKIKTFTNKFTQLNLLTQKSITKKKFSMFEHVDTRAADPIIGIVEEFKKDESVIKVNLSAGAYRDGNGKPFVLNCVKKAQKIILENTLSK